MKNLEKIFDLTGKTVIITGGAGYLGSAMSEAIVAFHGDLFILGRDKEKNFAKAEELRKKYQAHCCQSFVCDISDEKNIVDVLEKIVQQTGRIDVLINNAAYGCVKDLQEFSFDEWQKGIDGTINTVFRMTQKVLPYMIKQDAGNIINISSMYGMVAPNMDIYGDSGQNNPANYGAGKAAIIQFTKYLASVYAKNHIRANCISPGPFPHPSVQRNTTFIKELCQKNPMKRIGQPEDLCGIILYFASEASLYTTGQNIAIDGGWTSW